MLSPECGGAFCLLTSGFTSSPGLCYRQAALRAAVPYPPNPGSRRWHLGFLHRMGTAEGAVGQASPGLSHPACPAQPLGPIRPSFPPCAQHRDPSLRGAGIPRGLRLPWASPGKERAVCEGGTPPPALQGNNGAFQRASQALLPFT